MKNLIKAIFDTVKHTLAGATTAGVLYELNAVVANSLVGVATETKGAGVENEFRVKGVFRLAILSTDTPAAGDKLYWDDGNDRLTTTASTHVYAGRATVDKASGVAYIACAINEITFG